jgi:hypothetical protein
MVIVRKRCWRTLTLRVENSHDVIVFFAVNYFENSSSCLSFPCIRLAESFVMVVVPVVCRGGNDIIDRIRGRN